MKSLVQIFNSDGSLSVSSEEQLAHFKLKFVLTFPAPGTQTIYIPGFDASGNWFVVAGTYASLKFFTGYITVTAGSAGVSMDVVVLVGRH